MGPVLVQGLQQRGHRTVDGAEPDRTNCGLAAWNAPCRHLARDTMGLRQYRPADRTALPCTVAAVTMGPWQSGQHTYCPSSATRTRGPANLQRSIRRQRPLQRNSCTLSQRHYWRTAGKASSTIMAGRELRAASRDHSTMGPIRGAPRCVSPPASGTQTPGRPSPDPSRGKRW